MARRDFGLLDQSHERGGLSTPKDGVHKSRVKIKNPLNSTKKHYKNTFLDSIM